MATISPNNTERVAVSGTADAEIPNSSKYTKFLFVLEGCTQNAKYRIVANMGQGGVSPVPLEGLPTEQGMRWYSEVTVTNTGPSAFQVTLAAPAVAGLALVHQSGGTDNVADGTLHVSMSGSVYSQGLN